ncbi:ArsR/SmtB family transcription factor [Luteibaculum oceani]|nr:metalloregulator ArsR/SmtB family transcription factor [Luteibaculum oceani]
MEEKVFRALADEHRRKLLKLIHDAKREYNLSELSELFPMTRQGLSKHLSKLIGADLIQVRFEGREKFFRANIEPLEFVGSWLGDFGISSSNEWKQNEIADPDNKRTKPNSFLDFIESQNQ